jgi:hypothetical protein
MNTASIPITQGNLNNNHFYVTSCLAMFPAESFGGPNKNAQASLMLTLLPDGGEEVKTDIDSTKNIFRRRGWVAALFERKKASPGDFVSIRKNEDGTYFIGVAKNGGSV